MTTNPDGDLSDRSEFPRQDYNAYIRRVVGKGMEFWRSRRLERIPAGHMGLNFAVGQQNWREASQNGVGNFNWPFNIVDVDGNQILDNTDLLIYNGRPIDPTAPGVLAALPRRRFINATNEGIAPPQMKFLTFTPSRGLILRRFASWAWMTFLFVAGTVEDKLRRQDNIARRAQRMRQILSRGGGSAVKIGQHLAHRLDMMPWVLATELSQLVDVVPPFPFDQAQSIIEGTIGQPIQEIFQRFDPEPILATTIQNMYQARLKNGSIVVVKVRRPGAGELIMADLSVIEWSLNTLEWLTILRHGSTRGIRSGLRQTLLEEFNFTQEARHQDLFRRAAKQSGKRFFTSPRIHFHLSGKELVVDEFVGGMWLWELLAAMERKDAARLQQARELEIDPAKVARRLLWVNTWGWNESLFFYSNPQPDNIIVTRGSKLIFTEFSSVSAVDRSKRRTLRRNMDSMIKQDALDMARASLTLLEPLPPINLSEFIKELEGHNWQLLYMLANRNAYSNWTDLTMATQWKGLIEVCSKYDVVIDLQILRLLRSMMLFEGMAVRLDRSLDILEEYRKYDDHRATRARIRITTLVEERLHDGGDNRDFLALEWTANIAEGLFHRIRQFASTPSVSFNTLMSKWSFAFFMLIKFLYQVILLTGFGLGIALLTQLLFNDGSINWKTALEGVLTNRIYQFAILFLIFVNGRSTLFRMDDKEV